FVSKAEPRKIGAWHKRLYNVRQRKSVISRDGIPIHHVPPSLEVIGTTVLVFEIVGMLPHVDAKDRRVAIHQRTILIWRRNNFEFSVLIFDEPRPAAAESAHSSGGKFFLEIIKAAEG